MITRHVYPPPAYTPQPHIASNPLVLDRRPENLYHAFYAKMELAEVQALTFAGMCREEAIG